jgi:hypothetical protein
MHIGWAFGSQFVFDEPHPGRVLQLQLEFGFGFGLGAVAACSRLTIRGCVMLTRPSRSTLMSLTVKSAKAPGYVIAPHFLPDPQSTLQPQFGTVLLPQS